MSRCCSRRTCSTCVKRARSSSRAQSASRAVGGMARTWRVTITSRARPGAPGGGCFSSGRPSVGICTACSRETPTPMYAELHALTNFSFLRGASQPEELVLQATRLRYSALAITDECSLAGVVRAHIAAKQYGLPLIIGAEFTCVDDLKLVALATDRASYGALSRVISRARRSTVKGRYALKRDDFTNSLDGCLIIWLPRSGRVSLPQHEQDGRWLRERFSGRVWIGVELLTGGCDTRRLEFLEMLGKALELPCVAAGDVHMHRRGRRALQDVMTAIRLEMPLNAAGYALFSNGERCLRPLARLQQLYPAPLMEQTLIIAERCTFALDELRYEYPEEIVPAGEAPTSHLRALTEKGCAKRWPAGGHPAVPPSSED